MTTIAKYHERAWTADSLAASGQHLQTLGDGLARQLAAVPDEQLPEPGTPSDQVLDRLPSGLADVAAELVERLTVGPGIAVLVGGRLSQLTDRQLSALLYGLSLLIGRPIGQNAEDERIVTVRDERPGDIETARGYLTNGRMRMHTDPTDVAGLLCLQPAASGGANSYVSAAAIQDLLSEDDPATLHEYYRLWNWDLRGTQRAGLPPLVQTPIFSLHAGELSCRYGALMLREGERAAGGLTPASVKLLDRFEQLAQHPAMTLRYTLRRGESVWLNNYRVLHGRDAFDDGAGPDRTRTLLRTWVWLHERPRLASSFAAFAEAIDRV